METRILIFATNIKTKFYGHWCHRVLNLPTLQKGGSYQTNNPVHDTVCLCRLCVCVCICLRMCLCVSMCMRACVHTCILVRSVWVCTCVSAVCILIMSMQSLVILFN